LEESTDVEEVNCFNGRSVTLGETLNETPRKDCNEPFKHLSGISMRAVYSF